MTRRLPKSGSRPQDGIGHAYRIAGAGAPDGYGAGDVDATS